MQKLGQLVTIFLWVGILIANVGIVQGQEPAVPSDQNPAAPESPAPVTDSPENPPATPQEPQPVTEPPATPQEPKPVTEPLTMQEDPRWKAMENRIAVLEARLRIQEEREMAAREQAAIARDRATAIKEHDTKVWQTLEDRILVLEQSMHQLRMSEAMHQANLLALYQQGQQFQLNQITSIAQNLTMLEQQQVPKVALSQSYQEIGKCFYQAHQWKLALLYLQLAIQVNPNLASARTFLNENWGQLHIPEGMVYIPVGMAILGDEQDIEYPSQKITMKDFYLDQTEVTQKQFAVFVQQGYLDNRHWTPEGIAWRANRQCPTGWKPPRPSQEDLPITNVSYYEAESYCHWAGKRLPTAIEWEYAARGQEGYCYPWGNHLPQMQGYFFANYRQTQLPRDGYASTNPVTAFEMDRSIFGVLGMAGNVSEWTSGQQTIQASGRILQLIKGGSFHHTNFRLQSFTHFGANPNDAMEYVGFRCALDVPARP